MRIAVYDEFREFDSDLKKADKKPDTLGSYEAALYHIWESIPDVMEVQLEDLGLNETVTAQVFDSRRNMLKAHTSNQFDVFLICIDNENKDIEKFSEKLQAINNKAIFCYFTSKFHYPVIEFDYYKLFRKLPIPSYLSEIYHSIAYEYKKRHHVAPTIKLNVGHEMLEIEYLDIVYIKKYHKKAILVTKTDSIILDVPFQEILDKLNSQDMFNLVRNMYLVNSDNIAGFLKNSCSIKLANGETIPLSGIEYNKLSTAFSIYMANEYLR